MEISKIRLKDLKPYRKNAKKHPQEQIEQIKNSIIEFGMNDPIAVWGKENLIVEGHGRYEACKQLGMEEVDCIRLDHLTESERKAYALAHNKINMNSGFDFDLLNAELSEIPDIDMTEFGFDIGLDFADDPEYEEKEKGYSITYELVFNSEEEQQKWYDFLLVLKRHYSLDTIAERVLAVADEWMKEHGE